MDTEQDFVHPAFIHSLFFEQKNLIVYPYIDIKHLSTGVEPYTAGHRVNELDMSGIHDLDLVLNLRDNYSERPNFYVLYNCSKEKLKEILEMENLRCVVNVNEKLDPALINGHPYVLFNKKQKKVMKADTENADLRFEQDLIRSVDETTSLHSRLHQIFIHCEQMFTLINHDKPEKVTDILVYYPEHVREKLVNFVENFFGITVPDKHTLLESVPPMKQRRGPRDREPSPPQDPQKEIFRKEYDAIMEKGHIAREFVQILHEFKREINSSNLSMQELINPLQLYSYLRKRHWKKGIPAEFMEKWMHMENTKGVSDAETRADFLELVEALEIEGNGKVQAFLEETFPSLGKIGNSANETLLEKNNSQRKTESKTESESESELKRKPRPHRDLPPASDFTAFKQHTREIMRDVRFLCERLRKRREG